MKLSRYSVEFLSSLRERAEMSPRKRCNHNIHLHPEDACQRLFNYLCQDSYIRPHRHKLSNKSETLIALRGMFALLLFDEKGRVTCVRFFGSERYSSVDALVVIDSHHWHTVIALEGDCVLFEVKEGPYEPMVAKEFAPWAPPEGHVDSQKYLDKLRALCAAERERQLHDSLTKYG
jgi:cupin fold WbuC family metalloprotein